MNMSLLMSAPLGAPHDLEEVQPPCSASKAPHASAPLQLCSCLPLFTHPGLQSPQYSDTHTCHVILSSMPLCCSLLLTSFPSPHGDFLLSLQESSPVFPSSAPVCASTTLTAETPPLLHGDLPPPPPHSFTLQRPFQVPVPLLDRQQLEDREYILFL